MITNFLRDNKDIFAWKPIDMLGVPIQLAEHKLELKPSSKPIKQRFHRFSSNRKVPIKKQLSKLLVGGFIKEIIHPKWLAYPVLVRKNNSNI